jgi:hypothetical protein
MEGKGYISTGILKRVYKDSLLYFIWYLYRKPGSFYTVDFLSFFKFSMLSSDLPVYTVLYIFAHCANQSPNRVPPLCKKFVLKIQEYIHEGANLKLYIPEFLNFELYFWIFTYVQVLVPNCSILFFTVREAFYYSRKIYFFFSMIA